MGVIPHKSKLPPYLHKPGGELLFMLPACSTEVDGSFSKALSIIVQIAAIQIEVFSFTSGCLHFSRNKSDASRLFNTRTSNVSDL